MSSLDEFFLAIPDGIFLGSLARTGEAASDSTAAANPYLKRLLGLDAAEPAAAVRPFSPPTLMEAGARHELVTRLVHDGTVRDFPLRLRRRDGTLVWVEITAATVSDVDSVRLVVYALIRDVSEQRQRDAESRDLSHQRQQAEKMAALGQTISGVAHELNNPLATILNWAERLAVRPLDDISHRGATVILGEAERAARIVRNLLTFARKPQSTRSLIDLNHVVRETLALRQVDLEGSPIVLSSSLATDLPLVLADGHQIQQVLHNLVSNAEQAMLEARGSGHVVVTTRFDTARGLAVLEVADDGPGIPPDMRHKIFDPFFTTKEVGKGTGLGLTVAYALVEEHGGRIHLENPSEGGARFVVAFPCTTASPSGAAVPAAAPAASLSGVRLLLVEDGPALASAVVEALAEHGLLVEHAGDGEVALARLRHGTYQAIVCDLKMPRIDGMMLYRAIAASTPELARRVIFVTGDVAGTDAERFLAETGSRWLAKPFRLADLLKAVRETVG